MSRPDKDLFFILVDNFVKEWERIIDLCIADTTQQLPCQLRLKNTPTASLQRGEIPQTSVMDMTLNSLMVRFQ